ncbi:MAG: flagellar biosynthetic protein FliO [Syntrophomonadaceae bacterium]|nr:flagellar biosynthetic protein FliO [Syntrophomonadaceae bacterium]
MSQLAGLGWPEQINFIDGFVPEAYAVDDVDEINRVLDDQTAVSSENTNLGLSALKLVVILVLIIAAAWLIIKFFNRSAQNKMQGRYLSVTDEVILGQNRGIVLCSLGSKIYALGVTDHHISVLFEIQEESVIEQITQNQLLRDEQQEYFNVKNGFSKLLGNFKKKPRGISSTQSPLKKDFHKIMQDQVHRLKENSFDEAGDKKNREKNEGNGNSL